MSTSRLTKLTAFVLMFLSLGAPLFLGSPLKAEEPLRLNIKPIPQRIRSHTPLSIEIDLQWPKSRILEGVLELEFVAEGKVVLRYRSGELALSTGGQRFRVMLPPIHVKMDQSIVAVHPRFVTQRSTIVLEVTHLAVPIERQRRFIVGVSRPAQESAPTIDSDFLDAIQLERFMDDPSLRLNLSTSTVSVSADELPTDGLRYFCFDLLLLDSDGFAVLRRKQLEAMAAWVEAGGSVCVLADGRLSQEHVDFLNRMANTDRAEPAFLLDAEERLVPNRANAQPKKPWMFRPGLGRAVITLDPPKTRVEFNSRPWRHAIAFLWKIRTYEIESIKNSGYWRFQPARTMDMLGRVVAYSPRHIVVGSELVNRLIPEKVQGLPLSIVATILVVFLLAIGPLDYYLLGALNARKYTWVLFPLVSVLFTLFTVQLAQRFLGDVDYRNSLNFVDVGPRNRVVRSSRFEVIFTATQRNMETELRKVLFTPIDPTMVREKEDDIDTFPSTTKKAADALPLFEGHMPSVFTLHRQMRQWTPQVGRYTTLEGDMPLLPFDWEKEDPTQWNSPASRDTLRDKILAINPSAEIFLFHGLEMYALRDNGEATAKVVNFSNTIPGFSRYIQQISVRPVEGLFGVVSQISPTGSDNAEDLALLDPTNEAEWLLVVVITEGNDRNVYRKLYH